MSPKVRKIIVYSFLAVLFFFLGATAGWYWRMGKETPALKVLRNDSSGYKFVHPILLLQVPEDDTTPELKSLKTMLSQYINIAINKNQATDISAYYRDLNTSSWTGVNADDLYAPASMFKVATLIAFFHAAEDNPELLSEKAYLDPSDFNTDSGQDYYPAKEQAEIGHTYTVPELLHYMIINSDNNAAGAISFLTGEKTFNKTLTDLKIPLIPPQPSEDFLSVKMMSRLYRALYNGTYISQAFSEQSLELLSQTDFTGGLVAGVAPGIPVAHKFGERTFTATDSGPTVGPTVRELHDCGIVYAPNDPYFVCVMTKGTDFPTLQKIISDISGIVWQKTQGK